MARAARQLTSLLPAILCALLSLLLLQAPSAQAGPAGTAPVPVASLTAAPAASTDPHLALDAVAELPAAVEHSVRFPVPPAAPPSAAVDLSVPARGLLTGGPRRERAPPGDRHEPRDSRGPPSPRHS